MIQTIDPKTIEKPAVRCGRCDSETVYYNVFMTAENVAQNVCWECLQRAEKGFFTKRDFTRRGRGGLIPR